MPPLLVRNYDFHETETHAFIDVPWPAPISAKAADIYANDVYVKVHAAPYFFELDLAHAVDDTASAATIANSIVSFALVKKEPVSWGTAKYDAPSAADVRQRRQDAEARYLARQEEERKQRESEKWARHRFLVKQQMEVERQDRERVEGLKRQEKEEAENSIYEWAEETRHAARAPDHGDASTAPPSTTDANTTAAAPVEPAALSTTTTANDAEDDAESSDDDDPEIQALKAKYRAVQQRQAQPVSILVPDADKRPPPRPRGELTVTFTPRQLPTAARESHDAKWVAEMEEARRRRGPRQDEADALEAKARDLQRAGQTVAAVDAFSASLAIAPGRHRYLFITTCLIGRSECYEQLAWHRHVVDDVDAAVALLDDMEKTHGLENVYADVRAELAERRRVAMAAIDHELQAEREKLTMGGADRLKPREEGSDRQGTAEGGRGADRVEEEQVLDTAATAADEVGDVPVALSS
ncbi:Dynein assembly factor 4, axonemal [Allomyces javanicus]|nr:Dynein assembly factor 4, axonemal [Allomyces javanicus]